MSHRGIFNKTHLLSGEVAGQLVAGSVAGSEPQLDLDQWLNLNPGADTRITRVIRANPPGRLPLPAAVLGLWLRPQWMQASLLFCISLLFLLVRVALKLRSLRFHSPRLCCVAVFLIQTNVSLSHRGSACEHTCASSFCACGYARSIARASACILSH